MRSSGASTDWNYSFYVLDDDGLLVDTVTYVVQKSGYLCKGTVDYKKALDELICKTNGLCSTLG